MDEGKSCSQSSWLAAARNKQLLCDFLVSHDVSPTRMFSHMEQRCHEQAQMAALLFAPSEPPPPAARVLEWELPEHFHLLG